ncbi:UDP-2,3-diacylglucosamine diphosphatase [Usitatibacter palustris]|uniref:UDP-2,3-diacylglucosamine hydrolase n=1 Tax=Usitatibacter palustris TaxID=2732487 RepID=A0A6M4H9E1_9PROT|nr:UDP-2,3-diacylglucosamine diphosphatase [Usitatibacter palustris]QJR15815.1 UDP-2,3-diacylglucosamine hydrolase [Usitatibacter palustris]
MEDSAFENDPMEEDGVAQYRFRSIFISDIHLGTPSCQASHLLDFLRHTESEHLYLVGDIIDGWQLKRRWYWHQSHNDVIQKILRKARKGTKVTYVCGNHDEVLRNFLGVAFGGIDIVDEVMHTTADGRKLLVIHGDLFDAVVQGAKWLAYLGDHLYMLVLKLNQWFNHARATLGLRYWSLSAFLKQRVKNAVSYICAFEAAVAHEAKRRGADGVVCGHIHKAEIREIDGVLYCNDGDWVESLTALVELDSGELKIIDWKAIESLAAGTPSPLVGVDIAHSPGD